MGKYLKYAIVIISFLSVLGLGIIYLGSYLMKNSSAYQPALSFIRESNKVHDEIGDVEGFGFSGSFKEISYSDGIGNTAKYTLPVYGELGKVTVRVQLKTDSSKVWRLKKLEIIR